MQQAMGNLNSTRRNPKSFQKMMGLDFVADSTSIYYILPQLEARVKWEGGISMAKVMVVDDESSIVFLMERFLRARGHDVLKACDGMECLAKLKAEMPDLVLLDIMMPGLDGWEVCKEIKEDPITKSILVAMFSVKSDDKDKERSFEYAKADEHLSKGLAFREVADIIDNLLRANQAGNSPFSSLSIY